MTAMWVFDNVRHDLEAVLVEKQAILVSIQAPVVKWFTFVVADCLAV
jgi:hypothetical protein